MALQQVMFGGFYESMRDSKWFNDLYFFDFHTEAWTLIEFPSTSLLPCPRSGHQVLLAFCWSPCALPTPRRVLWLHSLEQAWETCALPGPWLLLQMIQLSGTNDILMYGGYSEVKVPGRPSKSVRLKLLLLLLLLLSLLSLLLFSLLLLLLVLLLLSIVVVNCCSCDC
jgi:hypothetical protein